MLNILRKNAQSVVVQAIVVIIAVVFIFWGVGTNLRDNPNALATVNGKEIPYRDFQQHYERAIEGYKQQFGGQMPQGFIESIGLKEQVLDQLIQSELLRQGAEQIGITIGKETVQRKIQEMAAFSTNGHFDLAQYKAVLEQNRMSPTTFESGVHNDLLINRVFAVVDSLAVVVPQEVVSWTEYIGQEIKLAYAEVKSESQLDKVEVSEDALAGWYEQVKKNYQTAPQCKLRYLAFSYDEDLNKVEVNDQAIDAYYREHAASYDTPEKRRARHILLRVADGDTQEVKSAKRAEAEQILDRIKKGSKFAQLAEQHSEDASKNRGGDLGFFSRGQMVQPFEEAVFGLKKGEVSGVVETPFGFHIIQLEEIMPAKTQTLAEVRPAIRAILERQGVKAITFKRASAAYEGVIRAGSLDGYSTTADASPVHRTDFFSRDTPPQTGMAADPAFVQAAFALRKGELSSIVETAGGYAILFVDEIKEAEVPALATVRDRVEADFRKEKSVELARAKAEALLRTMREQRSWPSDLERRETEYLRRTGPSGAVPESLRQDAFSRLGKDTFPDKVIDSGTSFYLYELVDSRQGKEELDAGKRRALEAQLREAEKNVLTSGWLGQLRKEANIWTNPRMLQ